MDRPLYARVVRFFEGQGWPHTPDDEAGVVSFPVTGRHGQWTAHLRVREEQGQLLLHSVLPWTVPEEHALEMTLFTTRANFGLVVGNFEFDLDSGELRYKTSVDLGAAAAAEAAVEPLIRANLARVDQYWPGLEAVSAGADPHEAIRRLES